MIELHSEVKFVIALIAPWLAVSPRGPRWASGAVPLLAALWLLTFTPLYAQGWGVPLALTWVFGLALGGLGVATLLRLPPTGRVPSVGIRLFLGLALAGLGWLLWCTPWL